MDVRRGEKDKLLFSVLFFHCSGTFGFHEARLHLENMYCFCDSPHNLDCFTSLG